MESVQENKRINKLTNKPREITISSKKWIILYMMILGVGIIFFLVFNYFFDPVGYYTMPLGKKTFTSNDYTRSIKAEYLLENKDDFDAVIMGGSKSGLISVELLNELTGNRYYNFNLELGNFEDYETYIRFLVEDVGLTRIMLHSSSYDAMKYSVRDVSDIYEVPARIEGGPWELIKENWKFLSWNIGSTIIGAFEEVHANFDLKTGQRIYTSQDALIKKDLVVYNQKYVIADYDKNMRQLFSGNDHLENADDYELSIESMKNIKKLCDENDVELEVVIGPSFVGELYLYEGELYYDYLAELVKIQDIWFFGDNNLYNRNPYNFIDAKHYNDKYSDLMIQTMYGKPAEQIGLLLTETNIEEYLVERRADVKVLKEKYEAGEEILQGKEHESYIN